MAKLVKTDTSQDVMAQTFVFNYDDTMVNTASAETAFGAQNSAYAYDILTLPVGSVIVGGNIIVDTAYTCAGTGTATLALGTSSDVNVLSNNTTVNLETAGITAITPEAAHGGIVADRTNIRATLTISDDAVSTGKVYVNILYVVENRANEVV